MNEGPRKFTNGPMMQLAQMLIKQQAPGAFNEKALTKKITKTGLNAAGIQEAVAKQMALKDTGQGVTIPQLAKLGMGAAQAHPYKALALGGSIVGNLGGLTDDDKIGGQIGGAALGALSTKLLGGSPVVAGLIGGNLGTLFDKLRSQKEAELAQAQTQPYMK